MPNLSAKTLPVNATDPLALVKTAKKPSSRRPGMTRAEVMEWVRDQFHKAPENECWIWPKAKTRHGYGVTGAGKKGQLAYTHRLMFELVNGEIPKGTHILHRCDNPACGNPAHLFAGTQADNVADMIAKGRDRKNNPPGENHQTAKLTWEQVADIRRRHARGGETLRELAIGTSVTKYAIWRVVHRKSWTAGEPE